MAEYSFPWDKDNGGDAGPYEYTLISRWIASLYHRDGIFPRDNDGSNSSLQVKQQTVADMTIRVAAGAAFVKGDELTERHLYFNGDFVNLTINDNLTADDRIDVIALRLNYATQLVRLIVKQGTPDAAPVAPAMQQDSTYWEVALAEILVEAGESTSIVTGDITQVVDNAMLLPPSEGGTGIDSYTKGNIIAAESASVLSPVSPPADYAQLFGKTSEATGLAWIGDARPHKLRANGGGTLSSNATLIPFASADWVNPASLITALSSNQFSLAAGTYIVEGFIEVSADSAGNIAFWIANSSAPLVPLVTSSWKNVSTTSSFHNMFNIPPQLLVSTGAELFEVYGEKSVGLTTATLLSAVSTTISASGGVTPYAREIWFKKIR